MSKIRLLRYSLFALLYFSQGAILSYFMAFNAIYLQGFNLSMSQIGLIGVIAMVPLVLKIFLGMLSDQVNFLGFGRRIPYIIIGLLIQAVCLAMIPSINPYNQYALFASIAFFLMTGMALYDTCTDGLALDTTPENEQGIIQGFMVGGRAFGVVIISAVIGIVQESTSWDTTFFVLAALSMIPLPLVLMTKETVQTSDQRFDWKAFNTFTSGPIITLGILGALYSLLINGTNQILNPFIKDSFGTSVSLAGYLSMVWGMGVVAGGFSGGWLIDRQGKPKSLRLAILLGFIIGLGLPAIFSLWLTWPLMFLFGLVFGYYETVYFSLCMNVTDHRIAASMYSILMAIANVGTGIGLGLSGSLVDIIGYRPTFILLALMNLAAFGVFPFIFKNKMEKIPLYQP